MDLPNDNSIVLGFRLMKFLYKLVVRIIMFFVRLVKNIIDNIKHR